MAKTKLGSNATFSGPQKGLTVIGRRFYAYSGNIPASGASVEYLNFSTGKDIYLGTLQFNGTVNVANVTAGTVSAATIKLNGSVIATLKADTQEEDSPPSVTQELLLPPNSVLQVSVISDADSATQVGSLIFIGRIYDE